MTSGHDTDPAESRMLAHILRHGLERPDDPSVTCGATSLSWGELRRAVLAAGGVIAAAIDGKPANVAMLGTAGAPLVVAYLATVAAGACAIPLQVSAHPDALAGMVENCEPALILAQEDYLHLLPAALRARATVLPAEGKGLPAAFLSGAGPLAAPVEPEPSADFNIIYSSGTTGRAKGIVHSHSMRYRQAARSLFGIDAGSVMLLATPLYSNTTLMPMLATLFHGGHVVLMPRFDVEGYLDLAERHRGTHTMLVPVQYQRILASAGFDRRDLSSFRLKQSTGAPLQAQVKREAIERWPGRFIEVYGLTEGGCTCILDMSAHPDKAHTVGRPAAGNDIRVIDEDGVAQPAGVRGEIVGRSATMMSGYFRNPEADAAFYWRDRDGVLFHRTGDIGMFDEDGFLVLLDRKKDLVISGGFNIYASDLEHKLLEHPDVEDAAVIGIPSEKWGETPIGLVVTRPGTVPDAAAIMAWTNERLGRTQRLSALEIRDSLPRSNVGKVLKQELRKPYWEKQP